VTTLTKVEAVEMTGSREVMVAILMIRQYREFIPKDAPVSHAIIDALLNLDGRIHSNHHFT
jgi:hypothetical protein